MPQINEDTARETYTIAGESFNIFQPYGEGHTLTGGEAAALNQVFAENIRNNFAAKVKEAKDAGTFDTEVFQGQLDDYMSEYEFGVRRGGGGGRTADPVMAEALNIARDKVRQAIRAKGHSLKDVPAKQITDLAKQLIEKNPVIVETARARVTELQGIAVDELDFTAAAAE